jgi:hypothetical protein
MEVKFEKFLFFNPLRQRNSLPEALPCISVHVGQGTNARMEMAVVNFITELRDWLSRLDRRKRYFDGRSLRTRANNRLLGRFASL